MTASAMLLQFILFTSAVTEVATHLPSDGLLLVEELPRLLYGTLLVSFGLFLPLMFMVGVLVTFRFAGPIYRFEVYLKQVIRGEKPADCRLRQGDELQGLCRLINQATEPLRRQDAPRAAPAADPREKIEAAA
jgi:signal peptidase II